VNAYEFRKDPTKILISPPPKTSQTEKQSSLIMSENDVLLLSLLTNIKKRINFNTMNEYGAGVLNGCETKMPSSYLKGDVICYYNDKKNSKNDKLELQFNSDNVLSNFRYEKYMKEKEYFTEVYMILIELLNKNYGKYTVSDSGINKIWAYFDNKYTIYHVKTHDDLYYILFIGNIYNK
jgi:hypothetical protein